MPLAIQTNIASLNTQRNLNSSRALFENSSINRLTSGLRVNSGQPPSESLAIAEALKTRVSAQKNAATAVGITQVLDSSLSHTTDVLQRMRELTLQAVNGTNTGADRDVLNEAFSELRSQAVRIAGGTSYNGENLLTLASDAPENITAGAAQLDRSKVALISNGDPDDGILTRSYDGFSLASSDTFNISAASSAEQRLGVLKALDGMISDVATARYAVGAFQSEAVSSVAGPSTATDPGLYTPAASRISDADYEAEAAKLREDFDRMIRMNQEKGAAILAQANNTQQSLLALLRG